MQFIKKILAIISVFISLFLVNKAYSIAIIPPIIYIATLSIGSFIVNLCIFAALWMATKGIIDRAYLGKKVHEIVRLLFRLIGGSIALLLSATISIIIFNPLNTEEIIFSSATAAFISLTLFWLSNFREYRLVQKQEKISILKSVAAFSALVFLATFISASTSLETKILRTNDAGIRQSPESPLLEFSKPNEKRTPESFMRDQAGIQPSENKKEISMPEPHDVATKKTLLFYPQNANRCEIYSDDTLISALKPSQNCYYYKNNNEMEKIYCPVILDISDVTKNLIDQSTTVNIDSRGSCEEKYSATLTKEGFKINE